MIKYFRELTKEEFGEILKEKITWAECAERYPQPTWCHYPDAVQGIMGCRSLMDFLVTGEDFCKKCDEYISTNKPSLPSDGFISYYS